MPQKVFYRLLKDEELEEAKSLYQQRYPWAPAPNWSNVRALIKDGKIVGMSEVQLRATVFLLHGESAADVYEMIARTDTQLYDMGLPLYEFTVPDHNKRFQKAIEKRLGVGPVVVSPQKTYLMRRE